MVRAARRPIELFCCCARARAALRLSHRVCLSLARPQCMIVRTYPTVRFGPSARGVENGTVGGLWCRIGIRLFCTCDKYIYMLPLLIATSLAFQPAPRLGSHRAAVALPAVHHQPRTTEPQAVLPVAAKYALLAAFFAGPTVQLGYAIEVSAGIENGPFYRFVKSDTVQKGGGKIRRIEDVPKVNVRGARLPAEAQAVAGTFRKEYSAKQLEQVYGALLRCYGNEERALAAIRTNPQILNPSCMRVRVSRTRQRGRPPRARSRSAPYIYV